MHVQLRVESSRSHIHRARIQVSVAGLFVLWDIFFAGRLRIVKFIIFFRFALVASGIDLLMRSCFYAIAATKVVGFLHIF